MTIIIPMRPVGSSIPRIRLGDSGGVVGCGVVGCGVVGCGAVVCGAVVGVGWLGVVGAAGVVG